MKSTSGDIIAHTSSFLKLLVSIVCGAIAFAIAQTFDMMTLTPIMIGWNAMSLIYLFLEWWTFSKMSTKDIRRQASKQDPKRTVVFILILVSTLFSILAIISMIVAKDGGESETNWRIPAAIMAMVLSWIMVHTVFTLRYAHMYYADNDEVADDYVGGLEFPDDSDPDYFDFAYFSFVLGMTFQVSDVEISSKQIRRLALLHGLLSFSFSTVIIGVVINVMSG